MLPHHSDWCTGGLEEHFYTAENLRDGFSLSDCQSIDAPTMIMCGGIEDYLGDPEFIMEFRDGYEMV